jgi:photosystem I P700 chlorophyll a apoprotein A1
MLFHGAYFSNYTDWLRDPIHVKPSSHFVTDIVGQDIINADVGGYFSGLPIASGLFQIWRTHGMVSVSHLKLASFATMLFCLALITLGYVIMHLQPIRSYSRIVSIRSALAIAGLSSLTWSGHILHISIPTNTLLSSGVDPSYIPSPEDLLSRDVARSILPAFGKSSFLLGTSLRDYYMGSYSDASGSASMYIALLHHVYLGIALIISSMSLRQRADKWATLKIGWHLKLAGSLLITSTLSFVHAYCTYLGSWYSFLSFDYLSLTGIYVHHMWIGGFLLIGAGAHFSIDIVTSQSSSVRTYKLFHYIIVHRDVLLGHLIWVVIFLGFHSFGIYIHNDTLSSLGRPEDLFGDTSLQLKPIFGSLLGYAFYGEPDCYVSVIATRLVSCKLSIGTSDFMIHHIHAFTIHTSTLIILKGSLYARSSIFVAAKHNIGFRFPCDGPGRGGSCQVSSWDHIFLSIFWMYNSISIVIFHYFWKLQSDVWGSLSVQAGNYELSHITSGDFSTNSSTINGWLRTFLWTQSSQVIQSYSTNLSGYGVIFLGSHLLWAFSLMFLYSGRGYWQELIESIVWSHQKLNFTPMIQPRALSISQGRAVGVSHYILGAIGCTWSSFLSRITYIL